MKPHGRKWIWYLDAERLHSIDFLAFRLGLFPTDMHDKPVRSTERNDPKRRRFNRLGALAERTQPCSSLFYTTEIKLAREPHQCEKLIKPFSSLAAMREMWAIWETRQRIADAREKRIEAEMEAKHSAKLCHPASLFSDESAVLHHFGMGAFVLPNKPGFSGLFRQHWRDFLVTEMVPDSATGSGGVALSRSLNFSIPPPPSTLLRVKSSSSDKQTDKHAPDPSFFTVNVEKSIQEILKESSGGTKGSGTEQNDSHEESNNGNITNEISLTSKETFYLQCYLHKQHTAHGMALSNIAQTLRMHPAGISVAGIKDYIGDTIQRVRLENITPAAAIQANKIFRAKKWKMTLSDFSYHTEPLLPGGLFGNQFKIVLRDVSASRENLEKALHDFSTHGFPNYYGCQRFSWFGGKNDAAFALLHHNWLLFAFRFLNYTSRERTLRELLQRGKKYPNPVQDEYRRNIVRRLRCIGVEPSDLDVAPFLSSPALGVPLTSTDGCGPINKKHELVILQLREAFFDLSMMSRRLTAQRVSSYLWNQVLTLRLHHFGGREVLVGDLVVPDAFRRLSTSREDRKEWHREGIHVVTDDVDRMKYSIVDVVHPGFSFNGIQRPHNTVGEYYLQVSQKYHLDWYTQHTKAGIKDFLEPPRPIIRKPINLQYEYNASESKLTLEFALERGSYANVAVTELMKQLRCAGSEDILLLPAPEAMWELGQRDAGYVTSIQDIYSGFEDGLGFVSDEHEIPLVGEGPVWDHSGPLFLPDSEDPARKAYKWGQRHLLRNMARRAQDEEIMANRLFERPLAKTLKEGELAQYAGHTVPMSPNTKGKRVFFNVLRRQRRYPGAPRIAPRFKRGAQIANRVSRRAPFKTIDKNTWNVVW